MTIVSLVAAFLMGLLWGWIHSVIWLQINIPILRKIAEVTREKPSLQKLEIPRHNVHREFLGSLFGTGCTGAFFAYMQWSELALSLYAIGLFTGFAPTVALTVWKYTLIILGGAGVMTLCISVGTQRFVEMIKSSMAMISKLWE